MSGTAAGHGRARRYGSLCCCFEKKKQTINNIKHERERERERERDA